jgi:hypothetical protein
MPLWLRDRFQIVAIIQANAYNPLQPRLERPGIACDCAADGIVYRKDKALLEEYEFSVMRSAQIGQGSKKARAPLTGV